MNFYVTGQPLIHRSVLLEFLPMCLLCSLICYVGRGFVLLQILVIFVKFFFGNHFGYLFSFPFMVLRSVVFI